MCVVCECGVSACVVCMCVLCLCGVCVVCVCVVCVCVQLSDQGDDFEDVMSEPRLGESEGDIAYTSGKSIPVEGTASAEPLRPEMCEE